MAKRPDSHGDGGEDERLYQLGVGHVLTEQDVKDIANLSADYNDEIQFATDCYYEARQQVLFEIGGKELVDFVNAKDAAETQDVVQRAMKHFYEVNRERQRQKRAAAH